MNSQITKNAVMYDMLGIYIPCAELEAVIGPNTMKSA